MAHMLHVGESSDRPESIETKVCALGEALAKKLAVRRTIRYPSGNVLFMQGDPAIEIHLIVRGAVKLVRSELDSRDVTIAILSAGWPVGVGPAILGAPHPSRAVTMVPTEIRPISAELFRELLSAEPKLVHATMCMLAHELVAQIRTGSRHILSVRRRLDLLLGDLAQSHGFHRPDGTIRIHLPLNQQEIADLIASSRESVNRAMMELRHTGCLSDEQGWLVISQAKVSADFGAGSRKARSFPSPEWQ